ncbi:unnamed protein product [Heterobilharzia americana]|nr:unnamed protein product [Heterobilharzia americana]
MFIGNRSGCIGICITRLAKSSLLCLRLNSGKNQHGDWFDFCDSNELLSSFLIWNLKSACTPESWSYRSQRYWLLYEQPYFRGPYILLGPGRCVDNVYAYKVLSISSVLVCVLNIPYTFYPTVTCQYPNRPWREFQSTTFQYYKSNDNKHQNIFAENKSGFGGLSSTSYNLTDLLRQSVNNK